MNIQRLYQGTLLIMIMLLLYNSAGCFFIFKLKHLSIQENMERKINRVYEEEELVAITFKIQDLETIHWQKKGKEFLLDEKRYDVVNVVKTDDTYTYWCFADEEEDHLFAGLDHHVMNNHLSGKHKPIQKGFTLFYPLYFFNRQPHIFYRSFILISPVPHSLTDYNMVYREVNHPPPSLT